MTSPRSEQLEGSAESTAMPAGNGSAAFGDEDVVARVLDQLDAASNKAVERWLAAARNEAVSALATAIGEARNAHSAIVTELKPLSDEDLPVYRNGLRARVLVPLRKRLDELSVEGTLAENFRALLDDLAAHRRGLADTVSRLEPPDLYAAEPGDPILRRLGKGIVRTRRTMLRTARRVAAPARKLVGRGPVASEAEQEVPLRRLASHHLQRRLPSVLEPFHESLQQQVGRAIAIISAAATDEAHALLRLELEMDGALGDALKRAGTVLEIENILVDARTAAADAANALRRDVRLAGTFMMKDKDRPATDSARSDRLRDRHWRAWHHAARSRLGLAADLLELRETTSSLRSAMIDEVAVDTVQPVQEALSATVASLRVLAEESTASFDATSPAKMPQAIRSTLDDGLATVEGEALAALREGRFSQRLESAAESTAARLADTVHALPERVQVNVLRADSSAQIDPEAEPRIVALREYASRSYDVLLLERLRRTAAELGQALGSVRNGAEDVPEILQFNLGAAIDEIRAAAGAEPPSTSRGGRRAGQPQEERRKPGSRGDEGGAGGAEHAAAAAELVRGGLERSADLVEVLMGRLADAVAAFEEQTTGVFETAFERLHERIRIEERMRGQLLDLQFGAMERMRQAAGQAAEQARRSSILVQRAYQRSLRRGRALVRLGQAAAGLAEATEEERLETVEALATVDRLTERLPIVYRRLFTFEPLANPALLEGRDLDLRILRRHVDQWRRGIAHAVVLTGFHGSGLTSFLNALRISALDDADVHLVEFRERLRSEEELAHCLADGLGRPSVDTLDRLADDLGNESLSERVPVCFVEHLEHLYLRQIGGTELVEKFLTFLSRTDGVVLWIVTTSEYGWQVITKARPSGAGLVYPHALSPIARPTLEAIVLNRHRRSGLPLEFIPPAKETSPIVHRRYRRARTEPERQSVLRSDYFDRLHRATGQNIMLALMYWLRSVKMDEDSGVLKVRPLQPLSFTMLHRLGLDQAFALKAFLEHASLTLDEHSEIFQVPIGSSVQIFEVLGNLLLIEAMDPDERRSRVAFTRIEEGVRYRVRPLLIHPIVQFLRGKNIVH